MSGQSTVLVVEDEESFIDALTVGLRREGFRVQVARDGVQALDVFDAVAPDLVLLDVMLPKMSGIDVCRQLRKRSRDLRDEVAGRMRRDGTGRDHGYPGGRQRPPRYDHTGEGAHR